MTLMVCTGFLILAGFINADRKETTCITVEVMFDHNQSVHKFISESDILELMYSPERNPTGKKLSDINMTMLESMVRSNPYVETAEVFSTIDGKLIIDIQQRTPLFRVLNISGEQFYVDTHGDYMPTSEAYTADVIIANGNISESFSDSSIFNKKSSDKQIIHLFKIAGYLAGSDFWNAQSEQLFVNTEGDIELVPRIGNHRIIIGDSDNLENKFNKLFNLYQFGFLERGWNGYSEVNLKFSNQVVCTRSGNN